MMRLAWCYIVVGWMMLAEFVVGLVRVGVGNE